MGMRSPAHLGQHVWRGGERRWELDLLRMVQVYLYQWCLPWAGHFTSLVFSSIK